jgi:DNA polymerase type B, organellar and viral
MTARAAAAILAEKTRRQARRAERARTDPAYRAKLAAKRKAQRHKAKPPRKRQSRPKRFKDGPFVGCDGEGVGRKDHKYNLFRMGSRELFNAGKRLTTGQLLAFILDHPDPNDILVGFAFDYDTNCILRDVRRERDRPHVKSRLERLLGVEIGALKGEPNSFTHAGWTWLNFPECGSVGVMLIKRNYISVCRLHQDDAGRAILNKKGRPQSAPGSIRTIYETWGFFQGSFVAALKNWRIGNASDRAAMQKIKNQRSTFERINRAIRAYNADECVKLAAMMDRFRTVCTNRDLRPLTWNGAGKLASTLLKQNGIIKRKRLLEITPEPVLDFAHAAYYGGRFEIGRAGMICEPVYEADINSAYPAAMLQLPCLEHGTWRELKGSKAFQALPDDALFLAETRFDHPGPEIVYCGLPLRTSKGKLVWQQRGSGVYWSPEIRSAIRLGAVCTFGEGYVYEKHCPSRADGLAHCPPPFAFVAERYAERLAIGKGTKGIPIKLALNSLYGKLAQRIGNPTFQNPIWAGLITATTRAKLNDAIVACGPANVVMLATDAILTTGAPPPVPTGKGLGEWGAQTYPALFVVRPGLYWSPGLKVKTRGIAPKFFDKKKTRTFQKLWDAYCDAGDFTRGTPKIPIRVTTFVTLRLAYRLGDFKKACQWLRKDIVITFDWSDKRRQGEPSADRRSIRLYPHAGGPNDRSKVYTRAVNQEWLMKDEEAETPELKDVRELLEGSPEWIDVSPPGRAD